MITLDYSIESGVKHNYMPIDFFHVKSLQNNNIIPFRWKKQKTFCLEGNRKRI